MAHTTEVVFNNLQGQSWVLSDDQGTVPQVITEEGTYEYGDYQGQITVTQTITSLEVADCSFSREVFIDCPVIEGILDPITQPTAADEIISTQEFRQFVADSFAVFQSQIEDAPSLFFTTFNNLITSNNVQDSFITSISALNEVFNQLETIGLANLQAEIERIISENPLEIFDDFNIDLSELNSFLENIRTTIETLLNDLLGLLDTSLIVVQDILSDLISLNLLDAANLFGDLLGFILLDLNSNITQLLININNLIQDLPGVLFSTVQSLTSAITGTLLGDLPEPFNEVQPIINDVLSSAESLLPINNLTFTILSIPPGLLSLLVPSLVSEIIDQYKDVIIAIFDNNLQDQALEDAMAAFDQINQQFGPIGDQLNTLAVTVINELTSGNTPDPQNLNIQQIIDIIPQP